MIGSGFQEVEVEVGQPESIFIFGTGGTTALLQYRSLLAVASLGLIVAVLLCWSEILEQHL